uniref:Band 7 domain-containing protein n=1 Tax=Eucampia antarctica TaxID=49252 RepID=A0A7S2WAX2_9STRA|mmetsp:Transcript_24531/g.23586  ORF Transcript_24531/g.23586 Transcript_24531/m.23586 type:complete len:315 (+) Transcript_24531:408-1352(+)|eukprot:CAMPEP_0197838132 /NCGR_PEP_ID=MMETSP1437-20131217/34512_1 /TAXON_ID=49252 ORGANISM="Eucampia antarctica, Strain CCMP1452" /NCGR_SAMPLE_ID=MMETSP1437 /ASSEMBLY_ACC=CAM_ASM_001096 /LENGTH=314 /DNA_ID=CAMNT_0043445735 /DNA_START=342 /DNA_END=1286 /DNA_ORIENTATION=-
MPRYLLLQVTACCSILGLFIFLLILLPLSFSYIDYYDYGLEQRKSTGKVNTDRVYNVGRYWLGPDKKFLKYPADQQILFLDEVSVFSDGGKDSVGLTFLVDIYLTYAINEQEVGELHRELAKSYRSVIESRTNDAIKNSAITITFSDYFENRKTVEAQFREAVQARWNSNPQLHVTLDQFHIGRIRIPKTVATKQLEALVQNERTAKEQYLQDARLEREKTAVQVNTINLQTDQLLRNTKAQAALIVANANAKSEEIKLSALNNGTRDLLQSIGIKSQNETIAYTYIRNLQNRENLNLMVSYLSDENIVKTSAS